MKRTLLYISLLLIALLAVGFWVGSILGEQNHREVHNLATESLASQLNHAIKLRLGMAERLAMDKVAINSLQDPNSRDIKSLFNTANLVANTDLIYVIDKNGYVVASSDSPNSPLIGRNYTFRPYFQEAIHGKTTVYPAVGAFTRQRGVHLSVPIYVDRNASPAGALVLKIGIGEIESLLNQQTEKIALVSPDGIILSSNQPQWLFHATHDIPLSAQSRLNKTRQFGFKEIVPLSFDLNRQTVLVNKEVYNVARADTMVAGWKLISLSNMKVIKPLPGLYKVLIASSLSVTGALALLTIALLHNIQRRQRSEAKLISAEKKYRTIFENAVMGIYQSTLDGRFVEASPSMATILGFENSTDLINGMNDIRDSLYVDTADRQTWLNLLKENGHFNGFVTRFRRKDGKIIWVSLSCRLIQDSDISKGMIEGFCLDVTERIMARKELENQRAQLIQADKMITMGVLTAGIAHEINNPNAYIVSSAEILADAWHDAAYILEDYYKTQEDDFLIGGMPYTIFKDNLPALTERIISGSRRINRIIKELLDYSRKDTPGSNELVDVNRVMTSVKTLLSSTISKNTNNFSMSLTPGCPLIRANFLRLEQVVINIIQNACQALPSPNCAIEVSTRYSTENHEVLIICRDEGIGISEENLKMITEPFFTTKREVSGTGLGLAISSSIMRDLGGTMLFDSQVGKGTTVILKFPEEQKNS